MASAVYETLNRSWKGACKALFGREVGELSGFEPWLEEYAQHPPRFEKSFFSGREVEVSIEDYAPGSRFISFDEADFGKKFRPLTINEIKDIDGIIGAIGERMQYTGNLVLGNSANVERSGSVVDSHFVWKSSRVSDSKYIACSQDARYCEHCFGLGVSSKSSFCVRSTSGRMTRCFETLNCELLTDAYYCALVQNSQECMFSFGCRSKNFIIGNLQLPKDKYMGVKRKLLAEMADLLERDKRIFSLFDVIEQAGRRGGKAAKIAPAKEGEFDKQAIEKAFSKTTGLVLGRELSGIDSYSKFLFGHVPAPRRSKSPLTGKEVMVAGFHAYFMDKYDIGKRTVSQREMDEIGNTAISLKDAEGLGMDPEMLGAALGPVAYACFQKDNGAITNVKNCAVVMDSSDCYEGTAYVNSKKCSHCSWPRESEYTFGSAIAWSCAFCLKCFYSKKLTRCFECDNCESCSDTYYSHNCENAREAMFCFNAKNQAYSIGNAPLPQDKYKSAKAAVLEQIATELECKKALKWDIFSLAAGKRGK
ncbi:MAG: hypothetical protein WC506_06125 [Candidatus Micrarchaeia archaeon]